MPVCFLCPCARNRNEDRTNVMAMCMARPCHWLGCRASTLSKLTSFEWSQDTLVVTALSMLSCFDKQDGNWTATGAERR